MIRLTIFFVLVLCQLGYAQKYPIHYKIEEQSSNQGYADEKIFHVSIQEAKSNSKQSNQLEMQVNAVEEIDSKTKEVSFSSLNRDDIYNSLSSSTNLFYLLNLYMPVPLKIEGNKTLIDSAKYAEKIDAIASDLGIEEFLSKNSNKFLIFNKYKSILNAIIFNDFDGISSDTLKKSEFKVGLNTYKVLKRSKKDWQIEGVIVKSEYQHSSIRMNFNPKTNLILSMTLNSQGSVLIDGKDYNYNTQKKTIQLKQNDYIRPEDSYYEMLIKGSSWSNYYKKGRDIDSLKFAQYINEYNSLYGKDRNYLMIVLGTYQFRDDYKGYNQKLKTVPSSLIKDSHHLRNKVDIEDLDEEDYKETVSLLTDEDLYDYLQISLSQFLRVNQVYAKERLQTLLTKMTDREVRAVYPMSIWQKYKDNTDLNELQVGIDSLKKSNDQEWRDGNVARYLMLLIKSQFANGNKDLTNYRDLHARLTSLYQANNEDLIQRAHLAYANFLLYDALKEESPKEGMTFIKAAKSLSAKSENEYAYQSYYDQSFTGSKKDYTADYLAGLAKLEGKDVVLDQCIVEFTSAPGKNFGILKKFYHENYDQESFASFMKTKVFPKLETAPAFQLKDLQGNDISLSHSSGKWTFIDFWGTWCGPCVAELPKFNASYEKEYRAMSDKLKVLTISCYDEEDVLKRFIDKNKYTFPVLISDNKVQRDYKVSIFPSKILVSPEGKLIPIDFGLDWHSILMDFASL